jgi:hypothetical protein
MISFSRLLLFILCLAVLAASPPVRGQDVPAKETQPAEPPPPAQMPEPPLPMTKVPLNIPMEAYGTANPGCVEWTDSCRTCVRDPENRISCSTPGIACLPQDINCKTLRGK